MTEDRANAPGQSRTPLLEWIASTVGGALLLMLVGVIGQEALRDKVGEPPAITVKVIKVEPYAGGHLITFDASNTAGGTASAVEVEATLRSGGSTVETASATLDYVAGHGHARGGVFFSRNPARHQLQIRALGYQTP